jgi:hypothetical protein
MPLSHRLCTAPPPTCPVVAHVAADTASLQLQPVDWHTSCDPMPLPLVTDLMCHTLARCPPTPPHSAHTLAGAAHPQYGRKQPRVGPPQHPAREQQQAPALTASCSGHATGSSSSSSSSSSRCGRDTLRFVPRQSSRSGPGVVWCSGQQQPGQQQTHTSGAAVDCCMPVLCCLPLTSSLVFASLPPLPTALPSPALHIDHRCCPPTHAAPRWWSYPQGHTGCQTSYASTT